MKPGAGQHPESSDREVLAGLVERVTFHNPENGFCVLRTKVRGHRDLVTVVGHAAMVGPGEWITASREWVNDRTHGDAELGRYASHPAPTAGQPTVSTAEQNRSKGRRKTGPFSVMRYAVLRVVPLVHRRAPRCFA